MAELKLTDKERAAPTYLEWDDAALGKLVKKNAIKLNDEYGKDSAFATIGAYLLVSEAISNNVTKSVYTIEGLTISGKQMGDWVVTLERVK